MCVSTCFVFVFSSVLYLELISQQRQVASFKLATCPFVCVHLCVCVLLSTAGPVVASMLSECPLNSLCLSHPLVLVSVLSLA